MHCFEKHLILNHCPELFRSFCILNIESFTILLTLTKLQVYRKGHNFFCTAISEGKEYLFTVIYKQADDLFLHLVLSMLIEYKLFSLLVCNDH